MSNSILEIKNLNVSYNNLCALEDINLKINKNDFITIFGPNGAGKTTLINSILGITKPESGEILLLSGKNKLGYVPQRINFETNSPLTVLEVVLMGRLKRKAHLFFRFSNQDILKAYEIMKKLNIYSLKDKMIGQISGGQLQKTLISRALASEPNILILDEPFAGLDEISKNENVKMLKKLNNHITIILVTHDIETAVLTSNKIVCLNKKVYYYGSIKGETNILKIFLKTSI